MHSADIVGNDDNASKRMTPEEMRAWRKLMGMVEIRNGYRDCNMCGTKFFSEDFSRHRRCESCESIVESSTKNFEEGYIYENFGTEGLIVNGSGENEGR